jgi:hypothetical protein
LLNKIMLAVHEWHGRAEAATSMQKRMSPLIAAFGIARYAGDYPNAAVGLFTQYLHGMF